jgi:hypothetical protein
MNIRVRELVEQARNHQPADCSFSRAEWLETLVQLTVQDVCAKLEPELARDIARLYGIDA